MPTLISGRKKVYRALLNQAGTAAPVATVLENTLGGAVVWTRQGVGVYRGTLTGVFPAAKTMFFIQCVWQPWSDDWILNLVRGTDDYFIVVTGNSTGTSDGILGNGNAGGAGGVAIEVLVYQ